MSTPNPFVSVEADVLMGPALDWAVAVADGRACTIAWSMVYPGTPKEQRVSPLVYLCPPPRDDFGAVSFEPSIEWGQGGPIVDDAGIATRRRNDGTWEAMSQVDLGDSPCSQWTDRTHGEGQPEEGAMAHPHRRRLFTGPTRLIAGLRCHVVSKLGFLVSVPSELCA